MTKDNQDDVDDEVENALKYLKPCFQEKQCKKKKQPSHWSIKSISSRGDELDC